jgi:hypothetical protein
MVVGPGLAAVPSCGAFICRFVPLELNVRNRCREKAKKETSRRKHRARAGGQDYEVRYEPKKAEAIRCEEDDKEKKVGSSRKERVLKRSDRA